MTAHDCLVAGKPEEALIELQNEIRDHPEDSKLRVFLFQLHCVLGNWPKALIQLQAIAGLDPDTMILAHIFQPVIQCEALRSGVFAESSTHGGQLVRAANTFRSCRTSASRQPDHDRERPARPD